MRIPGQATRIVVGNATYLGDLDISYAERRVSDADLRAEWLVHRGLFRLGQVVADTGRFSICDVSEITSRGSSLEEHPVFGRPPRGVDVMPGTWSWTYFGLETGDESGRAAGHVFAEGALVVPGVLPGFSPVDPIGDSCQESLDGARFGTGW